MATIQRRGKYFRVQIRHVGLPSISRTFDTRLEAEQWAVDMERKVRRAEFTGLAEAERTTLREGLERYAREVTPNKKGAKQEKNRIRQICAHPISSRAIAQVRAVDIAAYRDERLAAGKSPITVNNELILLSTFFTTAARDWGYGIPNPVAMVRRPKLPKGRDRRLLPGEEAALIGAADYPMRELIILGVETAMRLGELLSLSRKNIDLQARVAVLTDTKNDETRRVPLSYRAVETIRGMPSRIDGRLFPAITSDNASKRFGRVCKAAGIHGLRFHDLRHEATSRLFERGLSIMEVAAITGHKTLGMLKRYTHLRAEDLARKLGTDPE